MGKVSPIGSGTYSAQAAAIGAGISTEQQVEHLTKLVHILWKEVEKLQAVLKINHDGLQIKSGMSEVLVLKNGGIILNSLRISLKTPGKDQLMY